MPRHYCVIWLQGTQWKRSSSAAQTGSFSYLTSRCPPPIFSLLPFPSPPFLLFKELPPTMSEITALKSTTAGSSVPQCSQPFPFVTVHTYPKAPHTWSLRSYGHWSAVLSRSECGAQGSHWTLCSSPPPPAAGGCRSSGPSRGSPRTKQRCEGGTSHLPQAGSLALGKAGLGRGGLKHHSERDSSTCPEPVGPRPPQERAPLRREPPQAQAASAPARRAREGGRVAARAAPTDRPAARGGEGVWNCAHAHALQPTAEGRWAREVLPLSPPLHDGDWLRCAGAPRPLARNGDRAQRAPTPPWFGSRTGEFGGTPAGRARAVPLTSRSATGTCCARWCRRTRSAGSASRTARWASR